MIFRMGLLSFFLLSPTISYAQIDDSEIRFAFSDYLYTNCNEVRVDAHWHDPDFGDKKTTQDEFHLYCNDRLLLAYVNSTFELKIKFKTEQAKVISDAPIYALTHLIENIMENQRSPFENKLKENNEDMEDLDKPNVIFKSYFGNSSNSKHATYIKKNPSTAQLEQIRSNLIGYVGTNCSTIQIIYNFGTNRTQQKIVPPDSQIFTNIPQNPSTDPIKEKKDSKKERKRKNASQPPVYSQDRLTNIFPQIIQTQTKYDHYNYIQVKCDDDEILSKEKEFSTKIDFGDNANSATKMSGLQWFVLISMIDWDDSGFYIDPNDTVRITQSTLRPDGSESSYRKYTYAKRVY